MRYPIKHYKTVKQKKSKSLVLNIAMNPFAAALAVAVFLIITYSLWFF
jgi:hypothetical protein